MKNHMPEKFHLEPCPFCGTSNVDLVNGALYDIHHVECNECTARGPIEEDEDEAVDNWNQRA